MPLYEYRCESCGKRFEELVMNSREKVSCPDCESDEVIREVRPPLRRPVHLSGSP